MPALVASIVASKTSPVRVRRAPSPEPPFDDEPPDHAAGAGPDGAGAGDARADGAGLRGAGADGAGGIGAGPHGAGPHAAGADAAGGIGAPPLSQPGRGARTQRPVTPRQPRGPSGPPPGTQPAIPQAGTTGPTGHAHPAAPAASPPGSRVAASPRCAPGSRTYPTPATAAAQRFVGVCVEILNGHRAVGHLRAVTAAGELQRVEDQLVRHTTRKYLGRQGTTAPRPHRVRLRGLRVCEPRDGVAEIVAVLEYGARSWAMCVRLERRSDSWLCTLVQVV
jgi:Family of unknown function (DUF6459)